MLTATMELTPPAAHFHTVGAVLRRAYDADDADLVRLIESKLDMRTREFVRAKYARDYDHLRQIREWVVAGLPTGLHKGRGVEKMILHHLGHRIGPKSLQHDLRCTAGRAVTLADVFRYQHITAERLDALQDEAERILEPLLRSTGWL